MTTQLDNTSETATLLTTRQRQFLKGMAHSLSPLVQIGKDGLSSGVLDSVRKELQRHELIKVKIGNNSGLEKKSTSLQIASAVEAELVQLIGKTIILFKNNPRRPKEKKIKLPG